MYAGCIVEEAGVYALYENPLHPYTHGLLNSIPHLDEKGQKRLPSIPGEVPDLIGLPEGCNFSPRCRHADERCWQVEPSLEQISTGRKVACLKVDERDE